MSNNINYKALGERIRVARERNNLTQEKLAELCSLSSSHIGHIERGTRIPSLETVFAVSNVLDISFDSLLLDSFNDADYFTHLSATLKGKDPKKVNQFVAIVNSMAEKIDDII